MTGTRETMRIAIPIFRNRISPILDTCTRLMVADCEDAAVTQKKEIVLDFCSQFERFEILRKLNPDAVICCGVSDVFDKMLRSASIRLISGIAGDVDQVVKAFMNDRLGDPRFRLPGGK
jgi:predicted Fe-Mo cluster-binding NifX family protein